MTKKKPAAIQKFECPSCGIKAYSKKAPYCPCNPKAPYRMISVLIADIVTDVMKREGR